jgi:hypothetical protein
MGMQATPCFSVSIQKSSAMASSFAVIELRTRVYTTSFPQAAAAGNRQAKEITDRHSGHTSSG